MIMVYCVGALIGFTFSDRKNLKHGRENVRHSKAQRGRRETLTRVEASGASCLVSLRMGVLMVFEHSVPPNLGLVRLIKDREAVWSKTLGICMVWP